MSWIISKRELLSVLRGLKHGLEYGSRVRAVHSLIIGLLYGSLNKSLVLKIIKNSVEHGVRLGVFVMFYKLLRLMLHKKFGPYPWTSFVSGMIVGGAVFGKKSTLNQQIVLYLLSRVFVASVSLAYQKVWPERATAPELYFEKKYSFAFLAAISFAFVMWLFKKDPSVLQKSLTSSMDFLYVQSNQKVTSWVQYIPFCK